MRIIDRPGGKHIRIAERAALSYGAKSVAWGEGGKHLHMLIELRSGRTVNYVVPRSAKPNAADHFADWVRQALRRGRREQHTNGRK